MNQSDTDILSNRSQFYFSGKVDEKATQLHAIASLKVLLDATKPQDNANGGAGGDQAHDSGRASQGTEVS